MPIHIHWWRKTVHGGQDRILKQIFRYKNTPGTADGPGGRDRTLAVKSREKKARKSVFFRLKKN